MAKETVDRAQARRDKKAKKKAASRSKVYLGLPDEFMDINGEPWTTSVNGEVEELDLAEVLQHCLRFTPSKDEQAPFHKLDLYNEINDAEDTYIEFGKSNWEWMLRYFKESAHRIPFMDPDVAYLIRYIEGAAQKTPPAEARAGDEA